ncbi:8844_t:CDS:2, partial [Acaulospora morrowiae]
MLKMKLSYYAIQPDTYSGSDLMISIVDYKQNIVLLLASYIVSRSPIEQDKVKKQLIKSCMKFQYMECPKKKKNSETVEFSLCKKRTRLQTGLGVIPNDTTAKEDDSEDDENYGLDYTKNIKKYRISKVSECAKNHGKIKTLTENRKHIYVSVELPHRRNKRPELFRFNEYGDLVIIVDDRNMEHIFGPVIKELVDSL